MHGWVNPRRRGRQPGAPPALAAEPWRKNVAYQQLFHNRYGQASRFFEVEVEVKGKVGPGVGQGAASASRPEEQEPLSADTDTHPLVLLARQHLESFTTRSDTTIRKALDKEEPNLWLRRVRWADHLEGFGHTEIAESVSLDVLQGWAHHGDGGEPPERPVQRLQRVWEALERIFPAARASCDPRVAGMPVLFEVNRRSYDQKPRAPFDARLEKQTWAKYVNVWKRIVGFIVRTQQWEAHGSRDRPHYAFTRSQQAEYDELTAAADRCIDNRGQGAQGGGGGGRRGGNASTSLTSADGDEDEDLDVTLLNFLLALFNHTIDSDEDESAVLSSLAALGVSRSEDGSKRALWAEPADYLVNYAAVIKGVRLLIVHQATLFKQGEEEGLDPAEAKQPLFALVRARVRQYASTVSDQTPPTPFDWILDARSYGMKVQFTSTGGVQVAWRGEQLTVHGVSVAVTGLHRFISDLNLELRNAMGLLLLLDPEKERFPVVDLDTVVDDPSNEQPGYSLAHDIRNRHDDPDTWVVRRILASESLQAYWLASRALARGGRPLALKQSAASAYERALLGFRERLLLLIYLTSGQPPRTTEIMNLRHQNTPHGGARNLFLSGGHLCIKTWYHKGMFRTQSYKVILRFLPKEASRHFVRFIQLVLPFWQLVQGSTSGADTVSPFMWAQQPVYRSSEEDGRWASYEGRHVEMLWGSNHLRDLLSRHSIRLLGQRLIPSTWRHIAVAISRKYLEGIFGDISTADLQAHQSGGDSDSEDEQSPLALQTTHTSFTRDTTYGRTVSYGSGGRASEADGFYKASLLWHRFLTLSDPEDLLDGRKRKHEGFEVQWAKAKARRLRQLQGVDLLARLRTMLRRPDADFRGQQEAVLQAVVQGVHPILHVSGTGSGKTMAITLPAACSTEGVSVVIVYGLRNIGEMIAIQLNEVNCGLEYIAEQFFTHLGGSVQLLQNLASLTDGIKRTTTDRTEFHKRLRGCKCDAEYISPLSPRCSKARIRELLETVHV